MSEVPEIATCRRCGGGRTPAVEGLLLCFKCDAHTLAQATVSVQGRIEREVCTGSTCPACIKAG